MLARSSNRLRTAFSLPARWRCRVGESTWKTQNQLRSRKTRTSSLRFWESSMDTEVGPLQGLQISKLTSAVFVKFFQKNFKQTGKNVKESLYKTFMQIDQYIPTKEAIQIIRQIRQSHPANQNLEQPALSGTTANVIAIYKSTIYCANAGDSRSVLVYKDGRAVQLSYDHKPQNQTERQRIVKAGGQVMNSRIDGGLNLSRAIGDLSYKRNEQLPAEQQKVISCPDILQFSMTGQQSFILMGCDGIWDRFVQNTQGMADLLVSLRSKHHSAKQVLGVLLDSLISPKVCEVGCDNMSAVLVEVKGK